MDHPACLHKVRKAEKRKVVSGESLPIAKKQVQKQNNSAIASVGFNDINSSFGKDTRYLKADSKTNVEETIDNKKRLEVEVEFVASELSSVKKVDNVLLNFRCTICQELPRLLNRSELYRHYSFRHFSTDLMKEFGHLKTCPVCNIALKGNIPSHFGQKHSYVEHYLPVEAWIPISRNGLNISSGMTRGLFCNSEKKENPRMERKKLVKVKSKENFGNGEPIWPEIPHRFDIEGNERSPSSSKHLLKIARVDGFDIELENDCEKCFDKQIMGETSAVSLPSLNAHEQVMCRICKQKFDTKKLVVVHVQRTHRLRGSEDDYQDYETLFSTGYIVLKTRVIASSDAQNAVVEVAASDNSNSWLSSETQELTEEELEIVAAVENYQIRASRKALKKKAIADDDYYDKSEQEWEDVCDDGSTFYEIISL